VRSRHIDASDCPLARDLTAASKSTETDGPSQLLRAIRYMNERLVDVVGGKRNSTERSATGSAQIGSGSTDLKRTQ
jgi:methyl-accepting chemotaxis protein